MAMGVQYDSGREASMFALSLGGGDKTLPQQADNALKAAIVRQTDTQTTIIEAEKVSVEPLRKQASSFFLTYNLKGLNDTLIFDKNMVDMFV